ncbi:MAG: RagB/SusD family nutrient uptake outer membrane protein [Cyclobacteriaceae bacterium]|nr:RagB/SusD family nutrient uptake outer membrane protein [Cyclobacteriaceae bacterium]
MKKITIYFTVLLLAVSCNVLDQNSPNDVADSNAITTRAGAESALVGLYNSLQSKSYYGGYYPLMADLYSDIGTGGGYQYTVLDEISNAGVTSSNTLIENSWLAMYYSIATANAIINRIDLITDATFAAEDRNHIKAQALTIRALAHFDLLRMFGEHWNTSSDFGIPVVKTVQKATDVVLRSKVSESYAAILDDLQTAAGLIRADDRSQPYINLMTIKGLLSRVYLYQGNNVLAAQFADEVIGEGTFALVDASDIGSIYQTPYLSKESLFELSFTVQNQSGFNPFTYLREGAFRSDVLFLALASLNDFFASRPGDVRAGLLDFVNNDAGILPDGRTLKYRGEQTRDNPAFVIRVAELYLIAAEAKGLNGGGLSDLNTLRTHRGLAALTSPGDINSDDEFLNAVLDERKAELNFEGHRMFDLARTGKFVDVVGTAKSVTLESYQGIFPIPLQERIATKEAVAQNPGYSDN